MKTRFKDLENLIAKTNSNNKSYQFSLQYVDEYCFIVHCKLLHKNDRINLRGVISTINLLYVGDTIIKNIDINFFSKEIDLTFHL